MAQALTPAPHAGAGISGLAAGIAKALDEAASADKAEAGIKAALKLALADKGLIQGELPPAPFATYRQETLYIDPNGRFSIAALVWLPGHKTPVHDHRCWCCFGVWRGREAEMQWMEDDSGKLVPGETTVCYEGEVEFLNPPGDIHQVLNDGMTPTISIHIYGTDLAKSGTSIHRCYDIDARAQREAGLRTFAVVGGGFSGTMTAVHLLRSCGPETRIVLYETSPEIGRGVAYGTKSLSHLLNVPAGGMSAFPEAPLHFHEWCARRNRPVSTSDFAPRQWYGEYLGDILKDATVYSRARLEVRTERVVRIDRRGGDFQVITENGATTAEGVVLAIGTPPGRERFPAALNPEAWPTMADPWVAGGLDVVDADAELLIVGTGLTFMDLLAELTARGHRGKVTAISRRGLLPACHASHGALTTNMEVPIFDADAFREEIGGGSMTITRLCRIVRRAVDVVSKSGGDWRDVINAIRPMTVGIWAALSGTDRRRFTRHLKPYWETVRHRIAPATMAAAEKMRESGILIQERGGLVELRLSDDGRYEAEWARVTGERRSGSFDHVFNATGFSARLGGSNSPLIGDLLQKGWIREDELGLGVDTSSDFRLVEKDGQVVGGIYYVGPMLRARYWECTAVPELRLRASETAASVLKHAAPKVVASKRSVKKELVVEEEELVAASWDNWNI